MSSIHEIPEIAALDARCGLIRIPPELDVPLTPRVRAVIDTPAFHRLAQISQLGLVSLVYPAAHHHRFEHSLGVYRLCLMYLKQLAQIPRFSQLISSDQAERLIVAALLHDVGHWPFCHLIEDLQLAGMPTHEALARGYLTTGDLAEVLRTAWGLEPATVADLLDPPGDGAETRLLASILSGPIDVDKMDYLARDSLHAGVPYGRNFDQARLIGSLCLNEAGDQLALTEKGRTAAEMMVFARYVMFSEVYWHHAVRAATAMFQRVFYRVVDRIEVESVCALNERDFVETLRRAIFHPGTEELWSGLFGPRRRLFKRWQEYTFFEDRERYHRLARQPYPWLVACSERLADRLAVRLGRSVDRDQVLIDAPPRKLEVQFQIDIFHAKPGRFRSLLDVSPVVKTLAETQFDDYVKRVRVFVHPELIAEVNALDQPQSIVEAAIADLETSQ